MVRASAAVSILRLYESLAQLFLNSERDGQMEYVKYRVCVFVLVKKLRDDDNSVLERDYFCISSKATRIQNFKGVFAITLSIMLAARSNALFGGMGSKLVHIARGTESKL